MEAVEFESNLGIQRVIVEGNALKIVHALRHEGWCWSRYS